jgi:hypothetical protein
MKTTLILILGAGLFFTSFFNGRSNVDKDNLLTEIKAQLPDNWTMKIEAEQLIFEKLDSIWVLQGNWINAPASDYEDDELNKNRIMEFGKKQKARIVFDLEPKWSQQKMNQYKLKKTSAPFPDFNSSKYSLFKVEIIGMDGQYERVYPWTVNEETYRIYYKIISETLVKN